MTTARRRGNQRGRRPGAARREQQGRAAFQLKRWLPPYGRRKRRRRASGARRLSPRLRKALYWSTVAGLWLAMGLTGFVAYVAVGLPDTRGIWRVAAGPSIVVVDASGQTLATRGVVYGDDVALSEMAPYLPLAVLAAEDRRFYAHWGIDFIGLTRAAFANVQEGRIVQGGSTITQQLAKNIFLSPERTFKRKLQEALLAIWLEWRFTKDEILTLYLNRVYLGAGTYGVGAASKRYFDKNPRALSLNECAVIAGLLKAPSRFAPTTNPDAAAARAALVLDAMVEAGFIDTAKRNEAGQLRVRLAQGTRSSGAQYFVDWVLDQLPAFVGPADGELIVETTLHLPFQRVAEAAVDEGLAADGEAKRVSQAALISIDRTGAVRAMVGGRSYAESQFNRATQAQRQPGSAFKPFVFLTAIERGRTPQWRVLDAPLTLARWQPSNFKGEYRGEVNLTTALALSLNSAAVRLSETIGHQAVVATARRLGIHSPLEAVPSIALGTSEVNLLELASAYLPFATGGSAPFVHAIARVTTGNGRVLYERRGSGLGRVIAPRDAGAMNAMLRAAMDWGTGRAAKLDGRDAAGKTGTSQDYRDAWFVGYTANLVTGVWVGNDDGQSMHQVTGGALPARIWRAYMSQAAFAYGPAELPDGGYRPLVDSEIAEKPKDEEPRTRVLTLFERITDILGDGDGAPDEDARSLTGDDAGVGEPASRPDQLLEQIQ